MSEQGKARAREGVPDVRRITPAEVAEIAAVDARARAVAFAGLPAKIRALVFAECPWLPQTLTLAVGLHSRETLACDVPIPSDCQDPEWFDYEHPAGVMVASLSSYDDDGTVHLYVGPRKAAAPPAPEVA